MAYKMSYSHAHQSHTFNDLTMEHLFIWAVRNNSHQLLKKLLEINNFSQLSSKLTQMRQVGLIKNNMTIKILSGLFVTETEEDEDIRIQLIGNQIVEPTESDINNICILQINSDASAKPKEHKEMCDILELEEASKFWSGLLERAEPTKWQVIRNTGMYNLANWKNWVKITEVSPEEAVAEAARRGCKGFTYCKNGVILGQYGSFDRHSAILYLEEEQALKPQLGSAPGQCDYYYYSMSKISGGRPLSFLQPVFD